MPWTRRPPGGVPPARRRVRPVHRHRPAHPCAGGGGIGSGGLLLHRRRGGALLRHLRPAPIDREAAHARKQEVLRLLARRQVEEARGALRAWFALFGMVGADDVRWAVDTVNRMVISMEDWYYQFVTPPADGWEPPHSFTACRSRCSAMLEQVLRERRSRHSRPIETALNYIPRPLRPAHLHGREVAAQLYRSPEHFSRHFKEEVGENFSSYLTRYRLERAQELLQTTDLPVASVAVQTGYTTPGYFSRLYKKYKGVVPGGGAPGVKIVTKKSKL